MATIVERDSSSGVMAILVLVIVVALAVGGFFAYQNGVFGGPTTVVNKTINITEQAKPAAAPAGPAPAPANK